MGNVIDYITALLAEFFGLNFKTTEHYAEEVQHLIYRLVKDESNDADLTIGTVKFSLVDLYPNVKDDLAKMVAVKQAKAIDELMKDAKWIPAIRELRSITGLSLKDSQMIINQGKNGVYLHHFQAKELELTKQRNQELMEDLQSLADRAIELQSTITDLRLHLAKVEELMHGKDERIKQLTEENDKLQIDLTNTQSLLEESKNYNAKLHRQQADTAKTMRVLREDLATALKQIDDKNDIISNLHRIMKD